MNDLIISTAVFIASVLPNPKLTPGKANPILTQSVVCSKEFRTGPYRRVSISEKKRVAKAYGLDYEKTRKLVEYDHLISLELGGANADENLWPEFFLPVPGAHEKDLVENTLHRSVCRGEMTLEEAQHRISTDWYAEYERITGKKKPLVDPKTD